MGPRNEENLEYLKFAKKFPKMFNDSAHCIAVYTVFCILRGMRQQLGLEAMLDYMREYLAAVERHNPLLKESVSKALSAVSIEKLYKDAMS